MNLPQNPVNYFFLVSNVYILVIYLFHYYRNRDWFILTYIIGKSLQITGIILMDFGTSLGWGNIREFISLFMVLGFAFEIFGLISYRGEFYKRTFWIFVAVTLSLMISTGVMHIVNIPGVLVLDATVVFFFTYGGVFLLALKEDSRFRYLVGYTFLLYALVHVYRFYLTFDRMPFEEMPPFNAGQLENVPPPMEGNPTAFQARPFSGLESAFNSLMTLVSVVSGFGLLMILKEKDEIKLEILNARIAEENTGLKELNKERNRFFSIIAHDLKNPIAALVGLSDLLVKKKDDLKIKDYEKWMLTVKESSSQTLILLKNLLHWARSQTGTLNPSPQYINLRDLTDSVVKLMNGAAENKDIKISNDCPSDLTIYSDLEMTRLLFRNIISNATKFTPRGGRIHINAVGGEQVTISIADTGIGIPEKALGKIFALDSEYTSPGTEKEKGTGIGLKLVQEFVQKNNGTIRVESKVNEGSTFIISLPAKS